VIPPQTIFLAWLRSGGIAFGGGPVALESLRRELVERLKWRTEDEFARDWALCQAAPGINLLGFAALIGRQLGGIPGVFAAMLGMILPSATITAVLAAGFAALRSQPSVEAAMHGIVPATAGLGLASIYRTSKPLIRQGWKRKGVLRATAIALPILGLAGLLYGLPPMSLLLGGALFGAFVGWIAR
jgi:chromate transporter